MPTATEATDPVSTTIRELRDALLVVARNLGRTDGGGKGWAWRSLGTGTARAAVAGRLGQAGQDGGLAFPGSRKTGEGAQQPAAAPDRRAAGSAGHEAPVCVSTCRWSRPHGVLHQVSGWNRSACMLRRPRRSTSIMRA